jgi:phytoene dehydrogenase-like protein
LTAAFYLAKAGLKPLVLERRAEVGGGAITGEVHPGFRSSTLSHEILLHEQIVNDMDLRKHGVEFLVPDTDVCALTADRPPLALFRDDARTVDGLGRVSKKDAGSYVTFRETVHRIASVVATTFTSPPPHIDHPTAGDLWNLLSVGRAFRALGRRDEYRMLRWLTMPVADLAQEWFETELLRAAIAAPAISGTMFGPRSAGTALVSLMREANRLLAGGSSLRVRGGPGALTRAMAAAATAAGAEIRTNHSVERILVEDERVVGVISHGNEMRATMIISAVDPKTTFLRLIDPVALTPDLTMKMCNYRASGTVAKVNLALSGLPRFVGVTDASLLSGRIHIGPDLNYLERAFDHAKYGEISEHPWLDVAIPSIIDSALAPAGAHVASLYVHYAPYKLRTGDWSAKKDQLLTRVVDVLERYAPGVRSLIVAAQVISPAELESEYGFAGGHIFHGELAIDQLFTMRPLLGHARYESPIGGLYLCGGGTHPGGFMTGASGRLAARQIVKLTNS